MIKIEKIEFDNYRQYKNCIINFENKNEYNIYILRAKNGTGKTTFLNGILWCLYGNEYYISDFSKALKIINESAVQEANIDDVLEVKVRLTISDDDKYVIFERSQKFSISIDPLTELKKAVQTTPKSILKVMENPKNSFENAQVYESDDDTLSMVKQYFDEDIYSYYFFDGENLKNYFDKNNAGKVKESIYSLSQVNLLSNASKRCEGLSVEKSRELTKKNGFSDNTIYDKIDKIQDDNETLINNNKSIASEKPVLELRLAELNSQLSGYQPIRDKQARREELDKRFKQLKSEQIEFYSKKKEFIRTYLILFNLYPRIKSTLDMIKYKEEHGELPPRIDKRQIEELINNHVKNCPMCDGELNDHAILHMKQLLDDLDISSQASNYLSSIKGGLESAIFKCKKYESERKNILEKEKYYKEELNKIENELNTISKYLSTYTDDSIGLIDVSKLERERTNIQEELDIKQKSFGANEKLIEINNDKLNELQKQVKEMEKNASEKLALQKQLSIYRSLTTVLNQIKKNLMDEIKIEIQANTWKTFKNMIWKKETFNKLEINDDYQMSVYNNNLNDMTGSLSATESMALAYSFTLAVHETSGRNCPLVVDSPLGRVSDENRTNMAKELLKISKNKQIIMLFTPDEYSTEVSDIYDNTVASIRDISLTDDEKEINKLEV